MNKWVSGWESLRSWGEERAFLEAWGGGERQGPMGPPSLPRDDQAPQPRHQSLDGPQWVSSLFLSLSLFRNRAFLDTFFFFLNEYFKAYTSTHCPLNSGHFCKRLSSSSCVLILGSEDKPRWRPCHPHWRGGGWQDRRGTFQVWLPSQLHTTPSNSKTGSLKGWAWIPFSQDEVLCDF